MTKALLPSVQFALLIYDRGGNKINGTSSYADLDATCRLAESVLKITPRAAYVDIHPYVDGVYATQTSVETVHKVGVTAIRRPAAVTPMETPHDPVEDWVDQPVPVEVPAEIETPADLVANTSDESGVDATPGEPSVAAAPRKCGRPAKVKSVEQS